MAIKTRAELKEHFKSGNVVSEQSFTNLIDSTLNQAEDNLENSSSNGLMLKSSKIGNKFISFYKRTCNASKAVPSFFLELLKTSNGKNGMSFSASPKDHQNLVKRILSLITTYDIDKKTFSSKVGVNTANPEYTLDVNGTIGVKCIAGNYKEPGIVATSVISDGNWQSILTKQKGFKCMEISATVESSEGCYAIHGRTILADGAFNHELLHVPKKGRFQIFQNKLEVRWRPKKVGYDLQIRTRYSLEKKPVINYKLTKILI